MSTIKVDTIATRTGSGNITVSNSLASATVAGDLTVDTSTLKVDSTNNRVGIGTASPSRKLELNNGGTGAFVTFTDGVATNFTFKTDGSNVGTFGTEAGSTHLGLMASGTERVRIHSGGVMSVSNGIELGSGLDATAANILDDYEEGTWTPDIRNNDNANTFSTELGRYVKIGSVVYIYFYSDGGNTGGGGGLTVRNLPFTYTTNDFVFGARGMAGVNNSSDSTRRNLIVNFNSGGASSATLYYGGTFLSDTLSYVSGFAVYKTDS